MSTTAEGSGSQCKDCDPPVTAVKEDVPTQASNTANATEADPSSSLAAPPPTASAEGEMLPLPRILPAITIEFCDRCRWAPRATWVQTELFLTFPTPLVRSMTLIPLTSPETGGRFRVWVDIGQSVELVWDRKTEGGFPELKVLKQRIRNVISPDMGLGHSDKAGAGGHGAVTIPSGSGVFVPAGGPDGK